MGRRPMNEWFTATQIAGLPGMPSTARGVNKMGDRGELKRRPRRRGKGWEYSLASLPEITRAHLAISRTKTSNAADDIRERLDALRCAELAALPERELKQFRELCHHWASLSELELHERRKVGSDA